MDNKVYNNIYKKLIYDIRDNKNLSIENIDFIKSLSKNELIEIILVYDKITESNKKIHYEHLLNIGLKQFARYNPRFGRKVIVQNQFSINKNKKYINKINDVHIPYINKYDNDFMNNHLTLIDENTDSEDEDDNGDDDGNDTQYTSDEDLINVNNDFIDNELVYGRYNLEE
jgi:hypothetical protein